MVVFTARGEVIAEIARGLGVATNNVAEYAAVIEGLRRAEELGGTDILVRSDSHLLVEQLSGRYRVKNPRLQQLHAQAKEVSRGFRRVRFEHVPRALNKHADRLANRGVDEWLASEGVSQRRPAARVRRWEEPRSG